MAELTISADEIRSAIQSYVTEYRPDVSREEVGIVTEAGDGIARVEGLPSVMTNELLEFESGVRGLALNLDVREVGVVVLGDFSGIEEGQQVRRTGEVLSVPVGDGYLGRVVDPLGNPIDGGGEIETTGRRALELQAPTVVQRQSVHEPLQTGIKAIDAMTPIGRGQRQLVIGDRQTGKTAIVTDTIINQKEAWATGDPAQQVRCIYVAGRPEGLDDRGDPHGPRGGRRDGVHDHRRRSRVRGRRVQVHRPLHRLGHRPALDVRGQARPDRVRRPVQAGRGLPRGLAAAAPPAGPRGLPGRRLLPALPPAGALREAVRRPRRRLDDRAAARRDQGQRRVGLHPDQRHLDHRRPDLPRDRSVQLRCPPGHQRRHLGVPRRWVGPDQGHEVGGRPAAPGPRPVP